MVELEYFNRICDCCGSDKIEELWSYQTKSRTKSNTFLWKVRNVVCSVCGFSFVSPCPTEKSLNEYYSDSFEYFRGQPLDYSTENRIELLRKYVSKSKKPFFVEVGGNANERFQLALSELVGNYLNVELNSSCDSQYQSLDSLPAGCADILAAYFVLEHVPIPVRFLELCSKALTHDGLLIVEVPNLFIYPLNPAGLAWWEHTNHFSPISLATMASKIGFNLVELSYNLCSRPFGFTAVFRKSPKTLKTNNISSLKPKNYEYHLAKACIEDGFLHIDNYFKSLINVREKIIVLCSAGETVIIWGANKVCLDVIEGMELCSSTFIVDSNPEKANFLHPIPVFQPRDVIGPILKARLIIITTFIHSKKIISYIHEEIGREVKENEMLVIKSIG